MIITTKQNNFVFNQHFIYIFLFTKPIALWFSSVICRKPYILGLTKTQPFKSVRSEMYYPLVSAKINRTIRTNVKRLNNPFGGPDHFPAQYTAPTRRNFCERASTKKAPYEDK